MVKLIVNISTMILGIGLYLYADTLPGSILAGMREFIGPSFFPKIVGVLLFFLSIGHILIPGQKNAGKTVFSRDLIQVAVCAGMFGAAVLLIPAIGFYVTTFFFVVSSLLFLAGQRNYRSLRSSIIISAGVMLAIYVLFERLLWVLPPRGILF